MYLCKALPISLTSLPLAVLFINSLILVSIDALFIAFDSKTGSVIDKSMRVSFSKVSFCFAVIDLITFASSLYLLSTMSGLFSISEPVHLPHERINQRSIVSLSNKPFKLLKKPLPILGPITAAPRTIVPAFSPLILMPVALVICEALNSVAMKSRIISRPYFSFMVLNSFNASLIAFCACPALTLVGILPVFL